MKGRHHALVVVCASLILVCSTGAIAQVVWQKHPSNPVLANGAPGSWDEHLALVATVLFEGGVYKMWYEGDAGFGYATSADGLAWSKHLSNPVMLPGPPGSWDEFEPASASVVHVGGTYHMWYSAADSAGTNRIGHATSPDGISWTKDPANPVFDLGPEGSWDDEEVIHPTVIYTNNTYHMWYNGFDGTAQRILYAYSTDGVVWERFTDYPALDLGAFGEWDEEQLVGMSVVYADNVYRMWYTGWNQAGEIRIGYAVSPDGRTWWKDWMHNPVLGPGSSGSWDEPVVGLAKVIFAGTQYKMWYAGGTLGDPARFETGYATSDITITGVDGRGDGPLSYTLEQNYPNPFNPQTTIRFDLPGALIVSLRIYDVSARRVRELIDGQLTPAGPQTVEWDGRDDSGRAVASGVYFYRLEAGSFAQTRQMTLVK